ncbi:MAG TPA: transcription elongation factor GreA [Actinomycetota bacterium]|nr:transcription elongation factor GreA [Actinomycetota bacterium]
MLTRQAFDRLQEELDQLTTEGRRLIAERLLRAREHGDIRENAEYDAAKDEQGLMEARIRQLQRMLKDPDIVEILEDAEEAAPGVLATLRPLEEDDPEDELYLLAATKEERAPGARTVSVSSPLGQALLGRRVGDRITYQAPGGLFAYEVVALEPFRP